MKRHRRAAEQRTSFYLFLIPWIIGFLLFQLIPIGWGFYTSLTSRMAFSTSIKFLGFANYIKLLGDQEILLSFATTFVYALLHTSLAIVMGLATALLLERELPGRSAFRTILYFPYMIPLIAVGWIFRMFLDRDTGFFNIFLLKLHLVPSQVAWLSQFPLGSIVSLAIWQAGWSLIIFLGGLSTIPAELYEASTIDGANYPRRFQHIALPLLSPFIFFQFVSSMIYAMQTFVQSFILNPRPLRGEMLFTTPPPRETFFVMARGFFEVTGKNRFAYGLALLWLLFFVVLLITIIFIRLGGFVVYTETEDKG
jgi:ABC-type sugar transport system permease subunit